MEPLNKKTELLGRNFISLPLLVAALTASIALTSSIHSAAQAAENQLDSVLTNAVEQKRIPGVVATVATADDIVYQGSAGKRNVSLNAPMTNDAIFRIASMTKPVTSVAVMQLVERGLVKLDEPASTYLPELSRVQVLESYNAKTGKATLRPPKTPITVRQLLTHTSGFGYEFFDPKLRDYVASGAVPSLFKGGDGFLSAPLMFDPGARWEYGTSADWSGKLVEAVSKQSLEDYFHQHIFDPLGMADTFFNVPADKQSRLVTLHQRKDDGTLAENASQPTQPVKFFSGGGGLHSTAGDYLKFARMLLGGGKLGQVRILRSETVKLMRQNQIDDLTLGRLDSLAPQLATNGVRPMGSLDKFGLGLAINTKAYEGGRAAGSLAWSGIYNTFFWIDPTNKTCAVLMMQILPYMDNAPATVLDEFERAVYASVKEAGHRQAN